MESLNELKWFNVLFFSSFTLKPTQASGSSGPASPLRPRSESMEKPAEIDPLALRSLKKIVNRTSAEDFDCAVAP
jgi:hypothetical protein